MHGPRTGLWAFNTWMFPELLGPCCPARGERKQGEESPPRQGLSSFLPGGMRVGKEIDSHAIFCMPEFGKKSRVVSTRGKKNPSLLIPLRKRKKSKSQVNYSGNLEE